jgi:RNA polymerase sigma-70 factor (ECF subfamily)
LSPTSLSLLNRLRNTQADAFEWVQLQEIYQLLIRSWLLRIQDVSAEADDLAQDVLVVLIRELPSFERWRDGSFRAWLRKIALNRIRNHQKLQRRRSVVSAADDLLAQLEDPASDLSRQWEQDHDKHVFPKIPALVQADSDANPWEAFTRFAIDGRPAAQVAEELGMSECAVMQAKSRVLKRLREEAGELLD